MRAKSWLICGNKHGGPAKAQGQHQTWVDTSWAKERTVVVLKKKKSARASHVSWTHLESSWLSWSFNSVLKERLQNLRSEIFISMFQSCLHHFKSNCPLQRELSDETAAALTAAWDQIIAVNIWKSMTAEIMVWRHRDLFLAQILCSAKKKKKKYFADYLSWVCNYCGLQTL